MLTGIPRRVNVSLVFAVAVFVLSCGACAAMVASSYGATTVSGGSAGPLSGFPAAGRSALPFITGGSAHLSRSPEGAFGSFGGESPQALAVDQASGDVYAVDMSGGKLLRFTAAGAPADFSAGPGNGTDAIPGMSFQPFASFDQVAVDNSGGPSDGNVYVTQSGSGTVKVFSSSGEELATLTGSGTPSKNLGGEVCGVAVDQSDGDVYIGSYNNRIWRYSPAGAIVAEGDYSGGIETSIHPCALAVAKGVLYAKDWEEFPTVGAGAVDEYETSAFVTGTPPSVSGSPVAANATAVAADPASGDVYLDESKQVSVINAEGEPLYSFGEKEIGSASAGVAVRTGGKAYVSDATNHEIHAYGPTLEAGNRANLGGFGSFSGEAPQALAVDQTSGDVYAIDNSAGKLLRFTASGTPADFSAGPGKGTNAIPGLSFQPFGSVDEVAVDNSGGPSDGNVYVTQSGVHVVKVFSSTGEPLGELNGSGTPEGILGEDCGLAVDQSNGDLYIASFSGYVWRYSPSGSPVKESDYSGGVQAVAKQSGEAEPINPCGLAVAKGKVYVKKWSEFPLVGGGPVYALATSAFALGRPERASGVQLVPNATALATDPASGDVYVDEANKASVFNGEEGFLYSFATGEIGSTSAGIAVSSGGDAYVSDSNRHQIHIFGPFSAPPPVVETKPPTGVKHVKATLNGHLDPNNGLTITGCNFEWGTDTSYNETPLPCAQGNAFSAAADVSAELTNLTPGGTYHFRLHVTTSAGAYDGQDKSFETPPASSTPEVATGKGTALSDTSAQMEGAVDPSGNPITDCHFEYVTEAAFLASGFEDLSSGASVPCDQAPGSLGTDFDEHQVTAIATGLDPNTVYRYRLVAANANGTSAGTPAILPGPPIVETTGSSTRTTTTARLDSRVIAHGANTDYWFEYTTDAKYKAHGFEGATSTSHALAISDEVQEVTIEGEAGQFKLRLGAETTSDLSYNATPAEVQAALAHLSGVGSGNVTVHSLVSQAQEQVYAVTFVGALANTDVSELAVVEGTTPLSGGRGRSPSVNTLENGGVRGSVYLVSAQISDLQPSTTYDYRVAADNGTPGPPSAGTASSVTTRASDAPLSHGHFAGAPGSDRAWEQVNVPDTDGNTVELLDYSDNGQRALYNIDGGSPGSAYGGNFGKPSNEHLAERTSSGWVDREFLPTRAEAPGNDWERPWVTRDLNTMYGGNFDQTQSLPGSIWRMTPGAAPDLLYRGTGEHFNTHPSAGRPNYTASSEDGSRLVMTLAGPADPDVPLPPGKEELYDVASGTPRIVGLLPDGSVPTCEDSEWLPASNGPSEEDSVTPDGTHVFFYADPAPAGCNRSSLYDRDLSDSTTTMIASGTTAKPKFLRYAAGSVYFVTDESLEPGDPPGYDIYRYQVADHSLHCLTCSLGGGAVSIFNVFASSFDEVAVSSDGSRIYFTSTRSLAPGAANGEGIYRLDVASDQIVYVAPGDFGSGARTSAEPDNGNALTPDGSVFVFASSNPELNASNGQQNGELRQYYRYDDRDRSLVCLSCPGDGSLPRGKVAPTGSVPGFYSQPVSASGKDVAFTTPTPLVPADQNTAPEGRPADSGTDLYEWRDGRLLLITDGRTVSAGDTASSGEIANVPRFEGMSPSGRDILFTQTARLTPDAPDSSRRLYDARIGGGFEFPQPKSPCPLEACQPASSTPPAASTPGSSTWVGPGNATGSPPLAVPGKPAAKRCAKGKVLKRGKCVKKPPLKRCAKGRARGKGKCVRAAKRARRANHNQRGVK